MEEKIYEMVKLVSGAHMANTFKLAEKNPEVISEDEASEGLNDKINEITRGILTMFSSRA